jgi:hypothetical protein
MSETQLCKVDTEMKEVLRLCQPTPDISDGDTSWLRVERTIQQR